MTKWMTVFPLIFFCCLDCNYLWSPPLCLEEFSEQQTRPRRVYYTRQWVSFEVFFFITLRNSRHWDWGQQNKNFLSPPLNFYFTFRYQPTSPCADFRRERFHHHADLALQDGNYLWLPDWSHAHILIHRLHTHSEDRRTQLALLCHHR